MPKLYVITGASGAGKSTLCKALSDLGYAVVPEVALSVLQQAEQRGEAPLAAQNVASFMEEVLAQNLRAFDAAQELNQSVFFDRGIHECVAHMRLLGLEVKSELLAAASTRRYAEHVFVAAPWPEIYVSDHWRRFSFERAARSYESTVAAYTERGYKARMLPMASVEARVEFVLRSIEHAA